MRFTLKTTVFRTWLQSIAACEALNFTYIAALQPKMAFITDIRRQNMLELLMYKAIFELSPDRADFMSRLFARKRPPRLTGESTVTASGRRICVPASFMPDLLLRRFNFSGGLVHSLALDLPELLDTQGLQNLLEAGLPHRI